MVQETPSPERKEILHPENIFFLTPVKLPGWYPGEVRTDEKKTLSDKIRGDLFKRHIEEANKIGYSIVIVCDRDDKSEFINTLKSISPASKNKIIVKEQTENTYSGARRDAIRFAQAETNCKVIVMGEGEKDIIKYIPDMVTPILDGSAEVTITDRQIITNESISNDPEKPGENLRNMPWYQARSENFFNNWIIKHLKKNGIVPPDFPKIDWMGNRAWKNTPKVNSFFLARYKKTESGHPKMKPDHLSSSLFFPLAAIFYENSLAEKARKSSIRVLPVPIEYDHDKKQSDLENNDPGFITIRDNQRNMLIIEMVEFVKMLQGKPNNLDRY